MARISYSETSVTYPSNLRKIPQKSRPHLCPGWCLTAGRFPISSFTKRRPSTCQQRYAHHRLKSSVLNGLWTVYSGSHMQVENPRSFPVTYSSCWTYCCYNLQLIWILLADRGSTVVNVLCYKWEGRWFDPSCCQWIFYWHKILPITLCPWGRLSL